MNRFFHSALFPLIIIVVLAYLAMHALTGGGDKADKATYSEVKQLAREGDLESVVFDPRKQEIRGVQRSTDEKIVVHYASDQSQFDFEKILQKNNIPFDSKGTGSSPWWSLLTALLPFVILIASGSS